MSFRDVQLAARGHWPQILSALGVSESVISGKNQPCPGCSPKGKTDSDRFQFTDHNHDGMYHCRGCGAGDGFKLLTLVHGWENAKAVKAVGDHLGIERGRVTGKQPADTRSHLKRILKGCTADRAGVTAYLSGRGIDVSSVVLKYHPRLEYTYQNQCLGAFPAMIAPIQNKAAALQGLHRTYLEPNLPARKKSLSHDGKFPAGCAVRLMPPASEMGVAEGIETALSCYELSRMRGSMIPMWALISTSLMKSWSPPEGVRRVVICADKDAHFAGEAAAYELAHRLVHQYHLEAEVKVPHLGDKRDVDWNDVLNAVKRRRARRAA